MSFELNPNSQFFFLKKSRLRSFGGRSVFFLLTVETSPTLFKKVHSESGPSAQATKFQLLFLCHYCNCSNCVKDRTKGFSFHFELFPFSTFTAKVTLSNVYICLF